MQRVFIAARKAACVALVLAVSIPFASNGAQRRFVASSGSDANTCALNAPCRSFAIALAQTDAGGEIIVLDSAGYGRVTIGQSVSIIAPPGVYAGISVFAGENGVDVAGAGVDVKLRGLTINGQGGDFGISFTLGARLFIERCVISGMSGRGVNLQTGETYITDSMNQDNGSSGIRANLPLKLTVDRTRIERNVGDGIFSTNGPTIVITNSVLTGNSTGIDLISDDGVNETAVSITDSSISHSAVHGVDGVAGGPHRSCASSPLATPSLQTDSAAFRSALASRPSSRPSAKIRSCATIGASTPTAPASI